ncbi:MAG TPA: ATP-binding cassette domain-containing protein, partial [Solirubrobacteraceae bacterium]|nr:ATP-binding cassette domain-containing protein [Solirubrobacteraceae bacterium]
GARIFELLDREPRLRAAPGGGPLPPGRGRVEFRGVTFAYDGAAEPTLHDVDLTVQAGSTVALVGGTGSGKSTLIGLIPRLYDATAGRVLVDGADVSEVAPVALRREIALVTDDPFLFSASVHENIAYARQDASREEVVEAARRAQAHGFVLRLPDGYDTKVGERGLTLSGGQRQRIAIARALLADPRILILDDATSSVDASTEQQIKAALAEAGTGGPSPSVPGRTTFLIAHRMSTIALADEVAVLEAGRVAARGTHEELLELSPLYREIVEQELSESPAAVELAS